MEQNKSSNGVRDRRMRTDISIGPMHEDLFEKLKQNLNIAEVVERYGVVLNRHDMAKCPFPDHQDDTPSFSVNRKENYYKCFGCGSGGDCIAFVSKLFSLSMLEAAKKLADDFRIETGPLRAQSTNTLDIKTYLSRCAQSVGATDYWHKRGISIESIKRFSLGFDAERNCVTIPYSPELNYFQRRQIDRKTFYKPSVEAAGPRATV